MSNPLRISADRGQSSTTSSDPLDKPELNNTIIAPEEQRSQRSSRHRYSNPSQSTVANAYNIVRKWNLTFSGGQGEDFEEFITRIEENRKMIPVSDNSLLKCLPFILSGVALLWFRDQKEYFEKWTDFVSEARARFIDADYQVALNKEIVQRTQGRDEPVAEYLTCIRAMFSRLDPPWSESEQVIYAHRNLLPRYQLAIPRTDISDMRSLIFIAHQYVERTFRLANRYREPPLPDQSLLPNLAYRPADEKTESLQNAFSKLDLTDSDN